METGERMQAAAGHLGSLEACCAALEATAGGLTSAEAQARLVRYGSNRIGGARRVSPLAILAEQFKNVLIVILLLATIASSFLGHAVEAVAITVIVLFAVLLGFVQEYRAERAMDALRALAAPLATVLRDGVERDVAASEVVPGEVVLLRAGNRVPADARLLEAVNLKVQESVLTGESAPVEKSLCELALPELPIGDRRNMVFAGTLVTYGRGRALVTATGGGTEFGKIAGELEGVASGRTPLQESLDRMGRLLAGVAGGVVLLIVALGLLRGQGLIDMLMFGIALAVAVVPEALPAVVTISLAIGVQRLIRRNALIRRLPAVETLGSTSVICTDKTGTLTRDEMTVRRIVQDGRVFRVDGVGYAPLGGFHTAQGVLAGEDIAPLQRMLRAAALASDAEVHPAEGGWAISGDPTEAALIVAAAKAGFDKHRLDVDAPRVHEIPFASESKRMTTVHQCGGQLLACSKGAPEVILAACVRQLTAAGEVELDAGRRAQVLQDVTALAGEGMRVLAVADKPGSTVSDAEEKMVWLGLVGMIDPPRPEVAAALRTCETAGVRVVMITGDHPLTARAIAAELGILKAGQVVSGSELAALSDAELAAAIGRIDVFARVSPADKLRVVNALQAQGAVVGMTGDGVNDAPALKKADIGIAMGVAGTDVAREVSAMTLTDDNFASIVAAIEEGRAIYGNIKKYLMYLLSSNLGEILLMAAVTLFALPLPLTAVQLLYVNLATDGLPALALAFDPHGRNLMHEAPRPRSEGIFRPSVVFLTVLGGVWSAAVNLSLFIWAMASGRGAAESMTMVFVSLVLIQFAKAFSFRCDRESIVLRPFANRWLNLAILWEVMLLTVVVYVPALHAPFGTYALPFEDWLIVGLTALSVIPVLEAGKCFIRRKGW